MGWKLLVLAGLCVATLWALGIGPADIQRVASDAARGTASSIAPGGDDGGWGHSG